MHQSAASVMTSQTAGQLSISRESAVVSPTGGSWTSDVQLIATECSGLPLNHASQQCSPQQRQTVPLTISGSFDVPTHSALSHAGEHLFIHDSLNGPSKYNINEPHDQRTLSNDAQIIGNCTLQKINITKNLFDEVCVTHKELVKDIDNCFIMNNGDNRIRKLKERYEKEVEWIIGVKSNQILDSMDKGKDSDEVEAGWDRCRLKWAQHIRQALAQLEATLQSEKNSIEGLSDWGANNTLRSQAHVCQGTGQHPPTLVQPLQLPTHQEAMNTREQLRLEQPLPALYEAITPPPVLISPTPVSQSSLLRSFQNHNSTIQDTRTYIDMANHNPTMQDTTTHIDMANHNPTMQDTTTHIDMANHNLTIQDTRTHIDRANDNLTIPIQDTRTHIDRANHNPTIQDTRTHMDRANHNLTIQDTRTHMNRANNNPIIQDTKTDFNQAIHPSGQYVFSDPRKNILIAWYNQNRDVQYVTQDEMTWLRKRTGLHCNAITAWLVRQRSTDSVSIVKRGPDSSQTYVSVDNGISVSDKTSCLSQNSIDNNRPSLDNGISERPPISLVSDVELPLDTEASCLLPVTETALFSHEELLHWQQTGMSRNTQAAEPEIIVLDSPSPIATEHDPDLEQFMDEPMAPLSPPSDTQGGTHCEHSQTTSVTLSHKQDKVVKKRRRVAKVWQTATLKRFYCLCKYPNNKEVYQLAVAAGAKKYDVRRWFRNKHMEDRQKVRKNMICGLLGKIMAGPRRAILQKWLQKHKDSTPTDDHYITIMQQTGYTYRQIYGSFYRYKNRKVATQQKITVDIIRPTNSACKTNTTPAYLLPLTKGVSQSTKSTDMESVPVLLQESTEAANSPHTEVERSHTPVRPRRLVLRELLGQQLGPQPLGKKRPQPHLSTGREYASTILEWYMDNLHYPYPTKDDLEGWAEFGKSDIEIKAYIASMRGRDGTGKKYNRANPEQRKVLHDWYECNKYNPYPTTKKLVELIKMSGRTAHQITCQLAQWHKKDKVGFYESGVQCSKGAGKKLHKRRYSRKNEFTLMQWYRANLVNPNPTKDDKLQLALQTGLAIRDVSVWFAGRRNKNQKRLMESVPQVELVRSFYKLQKAAILKQRG